MSTETEQVRGRLNERDREILRTLDAYRDERVMPGWPVGHARPMDLGAWDGSDHSNRLGRLCRLGLVERWNRTSFGGSRGSYLYHITDAGRAAIAAATTYPRGEES